MQITPLIRVLNKEQRSRVHAYSLKILAETGVRIDSAAARELFAKRSCRISADNRVYPDAELVEWALASAPDSVDIFDRTRKYAFCLDADSEHATRFGIGVTNLFYEDLQTDTVRPFSLAYVKTATLLGDALSGFDLVSTPGVPQELSAATTDLSTVLTMTANTVKPLVILVSAHRVFEPVLDLLESLHGDLGKSPFIIPYMNPITPLVLNEATAEKMISAISRGLPIIYGNYAMMGATSPITPGGTLTLLNAELLVGLVFSQLVKEGASIILGSLPAGFDMQQMIGCYTPHTMLLNLACAEMMAEYRVPHCGTSGSGPGWGPDLLAGSCLWMNHLTACMGKVGMAPFVGGNLDSMVFSPQTVVYADEVIRLSRQFAGGFSLDDDMVAVDEIKNIGPGGNFLISDLTDKLFRQMHVKSDIWPVMDLDQWNKKGAPDAAEFLRKHTQELVGNLKAPPEHDDLMWRGQAFIRKIAGKEEA